MNFAVLQFPASNCDQDAVHAARLLGHSARLVWHKDNSLGDADAVIVPAASATATTSAAGPSRASAR